MAIAVGPAPIWTRGAPSCLSRLRRCGRGESSAARITAAGEATVASTAGELARLRDQSNAADIAPMLAATG